MNRYPGGTLSIVALFAGVLTACGPFSVDKTTAPDVALSTGTAAISRVTIGNKSLGAIALGGTWSVTANVVDMSGLTRTDRPVTWSSSDSSVATVSATGNIAATITTVGPGTVTIRATVDGHADNLTFIVLAEQAFIYSSATGITAIPMPTGVKTSRASAINDAGQVVGRMAFGTAANTIHAFIWSASDGMLDLGVLPGADASNGSVATAINTNGDVTGYLVTSDYLYHAFMWSRTTGMIDLGTLPNARHSLAFGINSRGDIVGYGTVGSDVRPFIWNKSTGMRLIGSLNDPPAMANAINDAGVIVGTTAPLGDPYPLETNDGVVWNLDGTITTLTFCGSGGECSASAINRNGVVTGINARGEAYLWSPATGMQPAGGFGAVGNAINDTGQIVGNAYSDGLGGGAFIWSAAAGRTNIGVLPHRTISYATGINNKGQVVGYSQ
jgi:probable HAF family extracellular repeat protein